MGAPHSPRKTDKQSDMSQSTQPLKGRQILLAEDCIDIGRFYLTVLKQAGTTVTLECNGQSAVAVVQSSPSLFSAILMDFQMPELDGLNATKQLREIGYSGAIIAITAYGSEELKTTWLEAGCDDYLEKPIKEQQLISSVLRLVSPTNSSIDV